MYTMKLRILEDVNPDKFFKRTTDFSTIDSCLKDKDYNRFENHLEVEIRKLNSDQFFQECSAIGQGDVETLKNQTRNDTTTIDNLTNIINSNKRLYMPYIDTIHKQQDGRHRVIVFENMFGSAMTFPVAFLLEADATLYEILEYCVNKYGKTFLRFKNIAQSFGYEENEIKECWSKV